MLSCSKLCCNDYLKLFYSRVLYEVELKSIDIVRMSREFFFSFKSPYHANKKVFNLAYICLFWVTIYSMVQTH